VASSQQLTEHAARHAVYIQRYAGGLDNKFLPFLEELKANVAAWIVRNDNQLLMRDELIRELTLIQESVYREYGLQLEFDLDQFGISESEWQQRSISGVVEGELFLPSPAQIIAAIDTDPLVFPDSNVAKVVDTFIKDWSESEVRRVNGVIRTGFVTGQSTRDIVRQVDTVFDSAVRRNNEMLVRTALNHVSSVGRQQTMLENEDIVIGYRWISTLDHRTSTTCRSLDQEVFLLKDKGKEYQPQPPAHPNCRSVTVAELSDDVVLDSERSQRPSRGDEGPEPVGATSSYYGWLKRQSAAFQDLTIGPTRGRLLRNGGITAEEFRRLSVDDKFRPLTLEEMEARDPEVFENAGIEL
jgi:SPP1 gp7 family putative phage head morphogenesis protein